MRGTTIALAIALCGCAGARLERVGDAMVRVERSTQGVVDGVSRTKDAVKDECRAQDLQTEAERMACVEGALKLVQGSKVAVQAVKAALVGFWALYPVIEARGKITAEDLGELAAKAEAVYEAYRELAVYAKELKP